MYLGRNQSGYVYIAWNKAMPRLVKIGATNKNPHHRLKVISSQSVPYKFELLAAFKAADCLEFEQYVHNSLRAKHEAKEFFRVGKNESIDLIDILCSTYQKEAVRVDTKNLEDKK